MTRLEVANVLNKIMIDNHFSILDRDNCYDKFSDKINSMQEIFHLRSSRDFTYFFAISHLLSDNENAVNEYLLKENESSSFIKDCRQPNQDDFLLVATAFEENPEFFSMAWNWVVIIKNRISSIIKELKLFEYSSEKDLCNALKKKIGSKLVVNGIDLGILLSFDLKWNDCVTLNFYPESKIILDIKDFSQSESSSNNNVIDFCIVFDREIEELEFAASKSSEGWGENITKIPVENLGELKILGDSDTQQVAMDFFIVEECQTMQFELTVEFELKGESLFVALRKETSEKQSVISTEPIDIDFSLGLKIKRISCKPL